MTTLAHTPALTTLSEDEAMFRDAVRDFAESEVAPEGSADGGRPGDRPGSDFHALRAGRDGHRDPRALRRPRRSSLFTAVLVVEELSRIDPSVAVLVDVQNTLVNNAILTRWGTSGQQSRYLPRSGFGYGRRLRPVGGGQRLGCLRAGVACGPRWRRLGSERAQDVDHQRRRGRALHHLRATCSPSCGTRGSPPFSSRGSTPGFTVGKKEDTSSASGPPPPLS